MNFKFRRTTLLLTAVAIGLALSWALIARADVSARRKDLRLENVKALVSMPSGSPAQTVGGRSEKHDHRVSPESYVTTEPDDVLSPPAEVDGHPVNHRLPLGLHCLEPVPEQLGTTLEVIGEGDVLVRVLVLLDEVEMFRASRIMNEAAEPYAMLKIRMEFSYMPVSLQGTEYLNFYDQVRPIFGGGRPEGIDLVHILTGKDITSSDGSRGVAGHARCIGGIRYREEAFSVSEAYFFGIWIYQGIVLRDVGAPLVVAHELGHLLGAHHHYGNCVEGNVYAAHSSGSASPCTIMDQTLFFSEMYFGMLEGAVIRGHAVRYAGRSEDDSIPLR